MIKGKKVEREWGVGALCVCVSKILATINLDLL